MSVETKLPYTSPASMSAVVQDLPRAVAKVFHTRLTTLAAAILDVDATEVPSDRSDLLDLVAEQVGSAPDLLWLAQSVISGDLPDADDMAELMVRARLGGTWAALAPAVSGLATSVRLRPVEVLRDRVLVDVHTTAASTFLSGIQRVVRETTARWEARHELDLLVWVKEQDALRRIKDDQSLRLFGHAQPVREGTHERAVVVPWQSTFLWVEVITELKRTSRLLAMGEYSRNRIGVLGYDSIPVTSSATVAGGMTSHFARGLSAQRRADRVALISESAAQEFRGVMRMGAGRREPGPEVMAVPLAVTAPETTEADLAEARVGLTLEGMPMVLVVGSHEPRKNHLAVLHAAELLWREGLRFNLVLVGAGSWNAAAFEKTIAALTRAGRPVQSIRGLPDRLLWAAYRLAHCTLFPSLNEGFGLPVAESLAIGTPVITSDFGSMLEILAPEGRALGGLAVDPRQDTSVADALRSLLTDTVLYARLRDECAERSQRSWDQYADELWDFLVDGQPPRG